MHGASRPADGRSDGIKRRLTGRLEKSDIKRFTVSIIVAGSRSFNNYELFSQKLEEYILTDDLRDEEIVFITGAAKKGPDDMIIRWCKENDYPWVEFPADWDNIDAPGAVVRTRYDGKKYNHVAGYWRNTEMAKSGATHLLLFWDGISGGSKHMRGEAKKQVLVDHTVFVDPDETFIRKPNAWKSQESRGRYSGVYREAHSR